MQFIEKLVSDLCPNLLIWIIIYLFVWRRIREKRLTELRLGFNLRERQKKILQIDSTYKTTGKAYKTNTIQTSSEAFGSVILLSLAVISIGEEVIAVKRFGNIVSNGLRVMISSMESHPNYETKRVFYSYGRREQHFSVKKTYLWFRYYYYNRDSVLMVESMCLADHKKCSSHLIITFHIFRVLI